jgi:dTDP-4-amino-4,6-dideoxygalactose transaminase
MSTFLGKTTFTPAAVVKTKGTPMFKDVDFAIAKDPLAECVVRNADPKAVFVVTGAGRGLGLEFVKQLVHRTKVRFLKQVMMVKAGNGIY